MFSVAARLLFPFDLHESPVTQIVRTGHFSLWCGGEKMGNVHEPIRTEENIQQLSLRSVGLNVQK